MNPNISVLFKALKQGWLPTTTPPTQKQWEAYKKNKSVSPQKSFIGYTLGFGGQYFGGARVRVYRDNKKFAANYLASKRKYLQKLKPYFTSSKRR